MEDPGRTSGSPIELLLGSSAAYDAAADLELVRKVGALAWLLTATLAAGMLAIWPPTHSLGGLGWIFAAAGLPGLAFAGIGSLRAGRVSLRTSLAVSLLSIVVIAALQALAGANAHYSILVAIPVIFVGASQALRRVGAAVALGAGCELVSLLQGHISAGGAALTLSSAIIWVVMTTLAVVWTAGVRWQRIALRDEQRHAHHLARHDSVTGLGNRRKLMGDLDQAVADRERAVIALFDLNGFKAYNDSFGHPAGDALLARLGGSLAGSLDGLATAYRMGGDEFCLLARGEDARDLDLVELGCEALSEHGNGFRVTAAGGAATLPDETVDPVEALRLADGRMYVHKHERRGRAARDGAEMLLAVLQERDPSLSRHSDAVARLAATIADRLGVEEPDRSHLIRAAQLHDIGKLAIPDAILAKPGALDEEEWAFIHRHTLIGERIVGSSPELAPVAKIIRASHERVDGRGYPDGLPADQIPLPARIIAVCDAYDAMCASRPYRPALPPEEIIGELRRCAGSQFDPAVAEILIEILESGQQIAGAAPATQAARASSTS